MSFRLTPFLREELEHYRSHNRAMAEGEDDNIEEKDKPFYASLAGAFDSIIQGRLLALDERKILDSELNNLEDRYEGRQHTEWLQLMAHCGALETFDSNVQYYPRRPRTRVIEGVRYIIAR